MQMVLSFAMISSSREDFFTKRATAAESREIRAQSLLAITKGFIFDASVLYNDIAVLRDSSPNALTRCAVGCEHGEWLKLVLMGFECGLLVHYVALSLLSYEALDILELQLDHERKALAVNISQDNVGASRDVIQINPGFSFSLFSLRLRSLGQNSLGVAVDRIVCVVTAPEPLSIPSHQNV